MNAFSWNLIRSINNSQNEGFEELVCQIARNEYEKNGAIFTRIGKPDGGRECEILFPEGFKYHFQAKFFTSALDDSQFLQITKSVNSDIDHFDKVTKYFIAIATDLPDRADVNSCMSKWNDCQKKWEQYAKTKGKVIDFIRWDSSKLISLLSKQENCGVMNFFFNAHQFTDKWFIEQNRKAIDDLQERYTSSCNVELRINDFVQSINDSSKIENHFFDKIQKLKQAFLNLPKTNNFSTEKKKLLNLITKAEEIDLSNFDKFRQDYEIIINDWENLYNELVSDDDLMKELSLIQFVMSKLWDVLKDDAITLFYSPFLLVKGRGGIGKSHLLAHTVKEFSDKGYPSILLLGQYFQTTNTMWEQVLQILECKDCSSESFLSSLNAKAISENKKLIIFIDAINEAFDIGLWRRQLKSFVNDIKRFSNLGLVISVRDEYENELIPIESFPEFIRINHNGFNTNFSISNAIETYKSFYNVSLPSDLGFIISECRSPLFLKLLFKSYKNSSIPYGLINYPKLFDLYLNTINKEISNLLSCSSELNIVSEFIKEYISKLIDKNCTSLSQNEANEISLFIEKKFNLSKSILSLLYSQGIFYKNLVYKDGKKLEHVFFEYEKLQNYLMAKHLCNMSKEDIVKKQDMLRNVNSLAAMFFYLFSIQNKKEFEDLDYSDVSIFSSLLSSSEYRLNNIFEQNMDDVLEHYLYDKNILIYLDKAFSEFVNGKSFIGVNIFLKKIVEMSLHDRDELFIPFFKNRYYQSSDLWALANTYAEKNDFVNDTNLLEICVILSSTLLSTNRDLRDNSTKALIFLLQDRMDVLLDLLKMFKKINDPYVYERLLAVSYGCVLRTDKPQDCLSLGKYIFDSFFNSSYFIFPHLLARDYARNIIEFLLIRGIDLDINVQKIRPPYKSLFPIFLPSNKCIDKKYGKNMITSSMTTEYGRGCCMYGDFGRYIFQNALQNWNVNYDKLSNWCCKKIFSKYGYYKNSYFLDFDKELGTGRHQYSKENERIGKKYQWITFFEILAKTADNKKLVEHRYEESLEYEGTWRPYVRDIDPTILIKETKGCNESAWWNSSCNPQWNLVDWLENEYDLPRAENLLCQKFNNESWLLLDGVITWKQSDEALNSKSITYKFNSYIVNAENEEALLNEMKTHNFNEDLCPEHTEIYQIFSREFFWSPAYKSFNNEYFLNSSAYKIDLKEGKSIVYFPTTDKYLWENEYDFSKSEIISFRKPSCFIFEKMNLEYSRREGEFLQNGKMICFDPSVNNNIHSGLFINKEKFISFLEKNRLKVIWILQGEKSSLHGISNINGIYKTNTSGDIQGSLSNEV